MILESVSMAEYRKLPAICRSDLNDIAVSPQYYKMKRERKEEGKSAALRFGDMVDCYITQPEKFQERFYLVPTSDKRSKAWKDAEVWAGDKERITADELETIKAIDQGIMANDSASKLIHGPGVLQAGLYWESMGRKCKGLPDKVLDCGILVDLKTAEDASPDGFERSAHNYRYHVQAAWYWDGYVQMTGKIPQAFAFVVVEKEAPFHVQVYIATPEFIEYGRQLYMRDLNRLIECEAKGEWPGYATGPLDLNLPRWVRRNGGVYE